MPEAPNHYDEADLFCDRALKMVQMQQEWDISTIVQNLDDARNSVRTRIFEGNAKAVKVETRSRISRITGLFSTLLGLTMSDTIENCYLPQAEYYLEESALACSSGRVHRSELGSYLSWEQPARHALFRSCLALGIMDVVGQICYDSTSRQTLRPSRLNVAQSLINKMPENFTGLDRVMLRDIRETFDFIAQREAPQDWRPDPALLQESEYTLMSRILDLSTAKINSTAMNYSPAQYSWAVVESSHEYKNS
jgi:hypothetical protein